MLYTRPYDTAAQLRKRRSRRSTGFLYVMTEWAWGAAAPFMRSGKGLRRGDAETDRFGLTQSSHLGGASPFSRTPWIVWKAVWFLSRLHLQWFTTLDIVRGDIGRECRPQASDIT